MPEHINLVLSGPSGVGKNSITEKLRDIIGARKVVSHTTRLPRRSEIEDIDYRFVSRQTFDRMIESGAFIEHMLFNGELYGVSRFVMEDEQKVGGITICDLSCEGALAVRNAYAQTSLVFLLPPSQGATRERLRVRGMSEAEITYRLRSDDDDVRYIKMYDLVVVNHPGRLDECCQIIVEFVRSRTG